MTPAEKPDSSALEADDVAIAERYTRVANHVSTHDIDLAMELYVAPPGDTAGDMVAALGRVGPRRPVYLAAFGILTAASLGLSIADGEFVMPNPLASLRIVFYADAVLVLGLSGYSAGLFFCTKTSISLFATIHGFNPDQVGLCFLPGAGRSSSASWPAALMDHNHRRVAMEAGFPIGRIRGRLPHRESAHTGFGHYHNWPGRAALLSGPPRTQMCRHAPDLRTP
ncbi:hypothetical protein MCOR02_001878 [Pyricularia oryzae]|nr:hypothetical protein MCOR02_001878 [Pyricularia oryzae]KAI6259346.1 hypothetical protein MCOR19_004267 [Pyricularia oryzae]KAI6395522.1 hypothetical protein MCOR20_010224 [Pyricularia oryzae]KAI6452605.1 hypothetical protein MCOR17_009502 [Pyricularia oryzae]KAI6511051.1 hypothetical protein MCOR13_000737 [Pyricularia oryzae]